MEIETKDKVQEWRRERRLVLVRNVLTIASCVSTMIMAAVLFIVIETLEKDTGAYVEAAQDTVKEACRAAEETALPADTQRDCIAAERNELPQALRSVVDDPDPDDPENQDRETQDPELQDTEVQDPESQDPELPDSEIDDPDGTDDPDPNDPEINDPDPDDPDPDDPEIQDEEVQDPEEQNAPVCPDGYTQQPFHYFGPDGVDNTGDEEDWILCKKVG